MGHIIDIDISNPSLVMLHPLLASPPGCRQCVCTSFALKFSSSQAQIREAGTLELGQLNLELALLIVIALRNFISHFAGIELGFGLLALEGWVVFDVVDDFIALAVGALFSQFGHCAAEKAVAHARARRYATSRGVSVRVELVLWN